MRGELQRRQLRVQVMEALERQVKQFRRQEDIWPFRVPHEPLDLEALIDNVLMDSDGTISADDLRSRYVLSMYWPDGHAWESWAVTLPSGIHVHCDTNGLEHRLLSSIKRGSALEADRFFLELLSESHGAAFGIQMGAAAPSRVKTPMDDRDFLADVFVDLLEGTPAGRDIESDSGDFRVDVVHWLDEVLTAPPSSGRARRIRRFREQDGLL
jgi:hypothetical protein